MSRETLEFFMSIDVPVFELYGMSECTGPQTMSLKNPAQWRSGSCGVSISGVETEIDSPDKNGNGEVSDILRWVGTHYLNYFWWHHYCFG